MKNSLLFAVKGLGLAVLGASIQALIFMEASIILQIFLSTGFAYLVYSSGKQVIDFFKKVNE